MLRAKSTVPLLPVAASIGMTLLAAGCHHAPPARQRPAARYLNQPLITNCYTADPSAHVFNGQIYIYASHDIQTAITDKADGNYYAMRDYHVFSMAKIGAPVVDHGIAFSIKDVPWASRQLWAPDAAEAGGRYYFYFPARDHEQRFRIGVAVGDSPSGPFHPEPRPIAGAYSIDPAVFRDDDGAYYLYFGGVGGAELQHWKNNTYVADSTPPRPDQPAVPPRVARLGADMLTLAEPAREIQILDTKGCPIVAGDEARRFFEASWVHKYRGTYYFSYSTGTTHEIVYATGASPYGPFTYRGVILKPVAGWTTQHSIVKADGKWWLFYHDDELSGKSNLRNVKLTELHYRTDGSIVPVDPIIGR